MLVYILFRWPGLAAERRAKLGEGEGERRANDDRGENEGQHGAAPTTSKSFVHGLIFL